MRTGSFPGGGWGTWSLSGVETGQLCLRHGPLWPWRGHETTACGSQSGRGKVILEIDRA